MENVVPSSPLATRTPANGQLLLGDDHHGVLSPLAFNALLSPGRTPRKLTGSAVRVPARPGDAAVQHHDGAPSGSVTSLAQVKAPKSVAAHLGSEVAVTPVRRSARLGLTPGGGASAAETLAGANFAFLPNAALLPGGCDTAPHALFGLDDVGGEAVQDGDEMATTAVEDVAVRRVSAVLRRQLSSRSSCSAASADSGGDVAVGLGTRPGPGLLYLCDSADDDDVDVPPAVAVRRCGSPLVLNRGGGGSTDSLAPSEDLDLDGDPASTQSLRRLRFSASVTTSAPVAVPLTAGNSAAPEASAALDEVDGEISPLSVFARVMAGLLTATIAATSDDAHPPDGLAALEQVTARVALPRADGAQRPDVPPCTFVYIAPAGGGGNGTQGTERTEYAFSLGRGGVHDAGFSASFLRADVAGNVAASGQGDAPRGEAGGEPSRFFYQVCHDTLALTPSSPPPACTLGEPGAKDACPEACTPTGEPRVCGNACSALLVLPASSASVASGQAASRCAALGDTAPVVSLLDAEDPYAGVRVTFSAATLSDDGAASTSSAADAAWACPGGKRTLTLDVLCPHIVGDTNGEAASHAGPLPVSIAPAAVSQAGLACAFSAMIRHPAACPVVSKLSGQHTATHVAATDGEVDVSGNTQPAPDATATPMLRWERTRRRIERHVGADEQYDHFQLSVSNAALPVTLTAAAAAAVEPLRCGFFAVSPYARFVRFNPPAATLKPGESVQLDIRLPSRYLAVPFSEGADGTPPTTSHDMSVSLQCNGGGDPSTGVLIPLVRQDWPAPGNGLPVDVRAAQAEAARRLVVVVVVLCLAGLCASSHARRHGRVVDGGEADDDGEGGITGRRSGYRAKKQQQGRGDAFSTVENCVGDACGAAAPDGEEGDDTTQAFEAALAAATAASLSDARAAPGGAEGAVTAGSLAAGDDAPAAASLPACAVCLVAPRDCVLLPCRHVATCGGCTRRMQAEARTAAPGGVMACPVCRVPAVSHVTLFVS